MNRLRSTPLPAVQLRAALASNLDALPDAELLDRFARYADHPAFEVLLRRHGPIVLGVCRRTLGGSADTDDAFQATFLVLLRKAKTVRGERLGPWLYGVAWRVAQKARARAARFAAHRTEGVDMLPAADDHAPVPDWLPVLDAELNALPAKYRDALVLCELQGRSRAAAARELGLREGTLSSRLARGRDLLRKRLLKHGTLLPAGGLAALFAAAEVGRATVPVSLLAAASELAKRGATGTIPAGAARLTDEVLKSMLLTKLRTTCCALVALACATAGLTAGWSPEPGAPATNATETVTANESPKKTEDKPVVAPQPADKKPSAPKLTDREALQGLWQLEKVDAPATKAGDKERREVKEMIGRTRLLVSGNSWWFMLNGAEGTVLLRTATADPQKNPKWLDLLADEAQAALPDRYIYEINGDTLRLCAALGEGHGNQRPAEFSVDEDVGLVVQTFRRVKREPAATDQALAGTWSGAPITIRSTADYSWAHTPRVVVADEYLFALVPAPHPNTHLPLWFGGKYTVDATKNPKWIDVELAAPFGKEGSKATKLYGSYEVTNGQLKMVLGTRRATRPLEFEDTGNVWVFDLRPAKPDALKPKGAEKSDGVRPKPPLIEGLATRPTPAGAPADPRPLPDKMEELPKPKSPADPAAVADYLKAWEKWSAAATNFRADVKLKRTAASASKTTTFNGVVLCMKPHYAVLRLDNADDNTKTDYEAYICNESAVYSYNGAAKTVTEFKRRSSPSTETGIFGFDFFTGVKARELQERFTISLLKTDEHYIYLDVTPKLEKDRREFQHLRLALYNPGPLTKDFSYMPAAAHMVKSDGEKEQWWFTNPQVNLPGVEPKHFQYVEIKDKGWTVTKAPEVIGAADVVGERPDVRGLVTKGPEVIGTAGSNFAEVGRLFATGRFTDAEQLLLRRAPEWSGTDRAVGQMMLGVCLIQLASQGAKHEAAERYRRAKDSFRAAAAEASKAPSSDKRAAWVLAQADVRTLQALLMSGQLDELLETAGPLAKKYSKAVDGLIVLSQMYNAHKQKGELTRAEETRDKMRQQFDALKNDTGAFPAESGEYSRSYWERTWFSSK